MQKSAKKKYFISFVLQNFCTIYGKLANNMCIFCILYRKPCKEKVILTFLQMLQPWKQYAISSHIAVQDFKIPTHWLTIVSTYIYSSNLMFRRFAQDTLQKTKDPNPNISLSLLIHLSFYILKSHIVDETGKHMVVLLRHIANSLQDCCYYITVH